MSYLRFAKLQGAGNDFIIVDRTSSRYTFSPESIRKLCDRKKGIGADGLMLLSKSAMPDSDNLVQMEFFNCDGSRASMCGNGLRCAASFARRYSLAKGPEIRFLTGAGMLNTKVLGGNLVRIELPFEDETFRQVPDLGGYTARFVVVGVPHAVVFVKNLDHFDVDGIGRMIRNHKAFQPAGTNVDFVEENCNPSGLIPIRTYERGVEAETLACGTGNGAAAYVLHTRYPDRDCFSLKTRSGDILELSFPDDWNTRKRMYLTGPAVETFHGATDAFDID